MSQFLSTREVARFLNINEKMVYSLVSEKGLPASKVTGKWLFPKNLVEQWVETHTINYPKTPDSPSLSPAVLIIAGSNDLLLDRVIARYNTSFPGHIAVFGNLGSMGGLQALRQNQCHIASSHLLQEDGNEYNFDFVDEALELMPAVVNFCKREQGILVAKGNPKSISTIADFLHPGIRMRNRPLGTGTRLLLDQELRKAGITGADIDGYQDEVSRHLDVGLEILAGRADTGLGIHAVAGLLGLDFIPLRWERYDLMIFKDQFFKAHVQQFLGLMHEALFLKDAETLKGYDVRESGRMRYPDK
ncbi:MAG: DNA-binding protein [Deltaproteobacteria bacterium]|nr:MAG: DNA-binding protein [Deltaproteobacteria bacterium]RUA02208.1 MAG: DNA-binding protein [Deltaproteobacteria bacterium]